MKPVLVPLSHKIGNLGRPDAVHVSTAKGTSPMLSVPESAAFSNNNHKIGVEGAEVEGIFNTFRADA